MFIYTIKASTLKLFGCIILCIAVLVLLLTLGQAETVYASAAGREINYGKADVASNDYKLEVAVRLCMGEEHDYCGIEGASVQTKVINYIQANSEIMNFKNTRVVNDTTVVDGLAELLHEIYENPSVGRLEKFVKEN